MMLRNFLVLVVGVSLAGCGSGGSSIAGTWAGTYRGSALTLTAKPDNSFTIQGMSELKGRWEVAGNDVKLFRDIRNGGDIGFGDGGDGALHFRLSKDGKTLDGKATDGSPYTFTRK